MSISSAVDPSAVARVVGIKTAFRNLQGGGVTILPQRIAVIGQGASASAYSTDKRTLVSAADAGETYGFGSPIHLAALQLLPVNGDGVGTIPVTVYPLEDAVGATTAAGSITPAGAQTESAAYVVSVNNILSQQFVIAVGDTVADITAKITQAINAVVAMPVIATDNTTDVGLAAKWAGASGNDIDVQVLGSLTAGTTFGVVQPTGGAGNPTVDDALAAIGGVWETMVLNCLDIADTTALNAYQTWGEGRWGPLVRKPAIVFTGTTEADVATAIAIPDARKTDRINSQLVSPGSTDLPLVVAARQLARIAAIANNNPPRDYGSQQATGLTPGGEGDQWNYLERDLAVKGGSSTVEVRDGVVNLGDIITFYHPTGETVPGYRYVVDVVKLQNILFNLDLIFATPDWDGAPLIPDDQPTANRDAKKPKTARAAIAVLLDNLGLQAIISDPATAKDSIQTGINAQNPKRLDVAFTVQLSGNTNIVSIDLDFGFFFGVQPIVG